jgi:hypothetical protein
MEQNEITYATVDKIIGKTGNFYFHLINSC